MGTSIYSAFLEPLESVQMQGARKIMTGTYMEIREDRDFMGNAADG